MKKTYYDKLESTELLNFPIDTDIEGFDKDKWKRVWVQAVEYWSEDDGWWYDTAVNGFKGWAERTSYEVYCDLRFTYLDGQEMTWNQLAAENNELGKFS